MKTLSWDPKAIKNLGPVGYAAQGSDEHQEFIEKIGILKNMGISISDKQECIMWKELLSFRIMHSW